MARSIEGRRVTALTFKHRRRRCWWLIWSGILCNLTFDLTAAAAKLPDIYWNRSNPIFRIDNTDHIIDVNKDTQPYEFDQVDIVCPRYPIGTPADLVENYIIYLVSRHEYDTCELLAKPPPRILARCDGNAGRALKYTISFRSFTPQPGGHEFRPGSDYHIISTSNGSQHGLWQTRDGACLHSHMKLTFKVCCSSVSTLPPMATLSTASSTDPAVSTATTVPSSAAARIAFYSPNWRRWVICTIHALLATLVLTRWRLS